MKKAQYRNDPEWKVVSRYEVRSGRCLDCDARVGVDAVTYRNVQTGKEVTVSERDECCLPPIYLRRSR